MNKSLKIFLFLAGLAVAAFFIFFRLALADPLTDEVEIAFRSLGYMDFLATPFQTTPYEWFASAPGWAKLSFHDHPPLVFLIQHGFFRLFGDSLFVLRLPFALAGLFSIIFIFLLARQLFDDKTAFWAIVFAAVNTYLAWISRMGLQEIFVIAVTLFGFWALLKSPGKERFLLVWGAALGLAGLIKYTALFVLLPVSAAIFFWAFPGRAIFKSRFFWWALGIFLAIFSPVIVYNLGMFSSAGHFDVQLASFLGQKTSHWPMLLGKQTGSLVFRVKTFLPNLFQNASPVFFGIYLLSLLAFAVRLVWKIRKKIEILLGEKFLFCALIVVHLLIILVGPSQRFLALLVPYVLILAAYLVSLGFAWLNLVSRKLFFILLLAVLAYEGFYNFQTNHAVAAKGEPPWNFSRLRYESSAWGYNSLESYLKETLDVYHPKVKLGLPQQLQFIEQFRAKDFRNLKDQPARAFLIVYDPRLNQVAKLWLYDRRYYYDGWPFVSADEYAVIRQKLPGYFKDLGIEEYFYIAASDDLFTGGNTADSAAAGKINQSLAGFQPVKILTDPAGQPTFSIYRFSEGF
ncbi:MAG: glycosyltransferase family 39 protein [Patescibacteria group bacterium]